LEAKAKMASAAIEADLIFARISCFLLLEIIAGERSLREALDCFNESL